MSIINYPIIPNHFNDRNQVYYFGGRIGIKKNRDFIDFESRIAINYLGDQYRYQEMGKYLPFSQSGINYNLRIVRINHIFGYLEFGACHTNFNQSDDLWGIKTGIIINFH